MITNLGCCHREHDDEQENRKVVERPAQQQRRNAQLVEHAAGREIFAFVAQMYQRPGFSRTGCSRQGKGRGRRLRMHIKPRVVQQGAQARADKTTAGDGGHVIHRFEHAIRIKRLNHAQRKSGGAYATTRNGQPDESMTNGRITIAALERRACRRAALSQRFNLGELGSKHAREVAQLV